MEQPNGDEAVMAMLGDWREDALKEDENINIEEFLRTTAQQNRNLNPALQSQQQQALQSQQQQALQSQQQQALQRGLHIVTGNDSQVSPPPAYPHKVPFNNRPSVLDLSTTNVKSETQYMNGGGHNSPHQQRALSPHSPHHSPYETNQQRQTPVFNYTNTNQLQQQPLSPHSPHSPHGQQPVSLHYV